MDPGSGLVYWNPLSMVGYLNARKKSLVLLQLNVPDFAGMSGWKVSLGVGSQRGRRRVGGRMVVGM